MKSQQYINLGLFILLIGIGALVLSRPIKNPPVEVVNTSPNYVDSALGITLDYPSTFTVATGEGSNYSSGSFLTDPVSSSSLPYPVRTSFQLNEEPYKGTNLSGAWVNLSSHRFSDDGLAAFGCKMADNGGQTVTLSETKDINGVTWHYGIVGDAAAGTSFTTTVYHALHGDTCVELTSTIAAGNIGNWEPGAIEQYDETAVKKQLEDLIMTAKFTN